MVPEQCVNTMSQNDVIPRMVPGAELFFGESVAQYLASMADDVYDMESSAEGLLIGRAYSDPRGDYVVISGVTQDLARTDGIVGMFRISEDGCIVSQHDLSRSYTVFGYRRAYMIKLDSAQGTMAMYVLENGVARKVPSAMLESL